MWVRIPPGPFDRTHRSRKNDVEADAFTRATVRMFKGSGLAGPHTVVRITDLAGRTRPQIT